MRFYRVLVSAFLAPVAFAQTGALVPVPRQQPLDTNGRILGGGCLYSYAAGTSTPQDTYSDADLAVGHKNTNPIVLDGSGRAPAIYLSALAYKFVYGRKSVLGSCPATPGTIEWTQDNVYDVGQLLRRDLADTTHGAELVARRRAGLGMVGTTVAAYLDALPINVTGDCGIVGDGTTPVAALLNACLLNGGDIYIPEGTYILEEQVVIPDNTTIRGAGPGKTILKLQDHNGAVEGKTLHNLIITQAYNESRVGTNVVIRDLTVDGNRDNITGDNPDSFATIWCNNLSPRSITGIIVQDIESKNSTSHGVMASKIDYGTFARIVTHGNASVGFYGGANDPAVAEIRNSTFTDLISYDNSSKTGIDDPTGYGYDGFMFDQVFDSTFTNLVAYTTWSDPPLYYVAGEPDAGWSTGLKFLRSKRITLTNFTGTNLPGQCLHLGGVSYSTFDNVACVSNQFPTFAATQTGIGGGLLMVGVSERSTGTTWNTEHNSFTNCKFEKGHDGAVIYDADQTDNTFTNCSFSENVKSTVPDKGRGLYLRGARTTISNSRIVGNAAEGIKMDDALTVGLTVSNTKITGNDYGIYSSTGNSVRTLLNEIHDNTSANVSGVASGSMLFGDWDASVGSVPLVTRLRFGSAASWLPTDITAGFSEDGETTVLIQPSGATGSARLGLFGSTAPGIGVIAFNSGLLFYHTTDQKMQAGLTEIMRMSLTEGVTAAADMPLRVTTSLGNRAVAVSMPTADDVLDLGLSANSPAPPGGWLRFWAGNANIWNMPLDATLRSLGVPFGSLGASDVGSFIWCTDCAVADPCVGGGGGAWAFRVAGPKWTCPF